MFEVEVYIDLNMKTVIWLLTIWVVAIGGYLLYEYHFDQLWPGAMGTIVVQSEPSGAEIYLDLKRTGKTTDAALMRIPRGKHSVIADLSGHRSEPFARVVELKGGQTDTVRFTMVPLDGDSAQLTIKSRKLDYPPETPRPSLREPLEPQRTALSDTTPPATPDTAQETAAVPASVGRKPDTTGAQEQAQGVLEVETSVPGAKIFVNDRLIERVTPVDLSLPFGNYSIRVELEGYDVDPPEQVVRVRRAAASQFVFFTLEKTIVKEFTVTTKPVKGGIYVDSIYVGSGSVTIPHSYGVFHIHFGDVDGWHTPEPVRLSITPTRPRPVVEGIYTRDYQASAAARTRTEVFTEGDMEWSAGIYFEESGIQPTRTFGPHLREIPGTQKFGWELAMGDPNRNPTGGDYVEFTFRLPDDITPDAPLNLRLYIYKSSKRYPLTLSRRSELYVTVNDRMFLRGYSPKFGTDDAELDRYEEWSLQGTLVAGENRVLIRTGEDNQVYNYLWKVEIH